eukprot:1344354-Rhodomonas_salina.3
MPDDASNATSQKHPSAPHQRGRPQSGTTRHSPSSCRSARFQRSAPTPSARAPRSAGARR